MRYRKNGIPQGCRVPEGDDAEKVLGPHKGLCSATPCPQEPWPAAPPVPQMQLVLPPSGKPQGSCRASPDSPPLSCATLGFPSNNATRQPSPPRTESLLLSPLGYSFSCTGDGSQRGPTGPFWSLSGPRRPCAHCPERETGEAFFGREMAFLPHPISQQLLTWVSSCPRPAPGPHSHSPAPGPLLTPQPRMWPP